MTDINKQVNERDPRAHVANEPPAGAPHSLWTHPDLIAGIVIILAAGALLTRTVAMPVMTALLPVVMLGALVVLAALMIGRALLGGRSGRKLAPRYPVFANAGAFAGIVLAIALYIAGVVALGFYTSTAIMLPVVAWCFGYRDIKRLLLANVIFTGGLALIFVVLMGQELPAEFFTR